MYHQLVHTLIEVLPPPRGGTPVGLQARKLSAIGKIAALAPLNADEADLAAHCIAARAQADEMLRLARLNEHDPALAGRLNAEYRSTMRLWLAVYTQLKRVQAERRKRDANAETANEDAWARHIAERSMLAVLEAQPEAGAAEPVRPQPAPVAAPTVAPVAPKANTSQNETNSHNVAFETPMSAHLVVKAPNPTGLHTTLLATTHLTPSGYHTRHGTNDRPGATIPANAVPEATNPRPSPLNPTSPQADPARNVPENKIDPQDVAFETWLSAETSINPGDATLREIMREMMGLPLKGPKRGIGLIRSALRSAASAIENSAR